MEDIVDKLKCNPPPSIVSLELHQTYCTFIEDLDLNGTKLKYIHRYGIGELAVMTIEMIALRADLKTNGEHVEVQGDRNVVRKANPSRAALDKLVTAYSRMLKEFKMTPASELSGRKSDETKSSPAGITGV